MILLSSLYIILAVLLTCVYLYWKLFVHEEQNHEAGMNWKTS